MSVKMYNQSDHYTYILELIFACYMYHVRHV